MTLKRGIGIFLVILSAVLLVVTVQSVGDNLAKTGAAAGKINSYIPPYPNAGVHVILIGIASVVSFLAGIVLISIGKKR